MIGGILMSQITAPTAALRWAGAERTVTMIVLTETYKAVQGKESTAFTVFVGIVVAVIVAVAIWAAVCVWRGR